VCFLSCWDEQRIQKGDFCIDKSVIRLPRQHLPFTDGRVCDEEAGEGRWAGGRV
jgi:hypothetical protein